MRKSEARRILLVVLLLSLAAIACNLPGGGVEPEETGEAPTVPPATAEAGEQAAQPSGDVTAFKQSLVNALADPNRSYENLQTFMGEEFWIFDKFSAMNYPPAQAIEDLRSYSFPPQNTISADLNADPVAMLGFDPPPADHYVYTTGWGDGSMIGVLLINQNPDGSYYWYGVLVTYAESADVPPPGGDPAFGFKQALLLALTPPRDYANLPTYMGDHFEIIHWYGGFDVFAPADMVNVLADSYLPPGQTLTFEENVDYNSLIGDSPYLLYPFAADFWYTRGWGMDGMDETLILIAQNSDGSYYWYGLLYAEGGFSPQAAASGGDWQPLPAEICTDLQVSVSEQLGEVDVVLYETAPFTDYVNGTSGEGCRIVVEGTDADGIDFWAVYDQLGQTLATTGWTRDMMYDADGPTGSMSGYRRDSGLILLHVGWEPSEDANCPQDQPIGACELAPEQRLWILELQAAMQ